MQATQSFAKRLLPRSLRRGLARLRLKATGDSAIESYFRQHAVRKLQIGSGRNKLSGWLNTDLTPLESGVVFLDALERFPFCDGTFDYAFSEHFMEHLEYLQGREVLGEIVRVLKPGGKLRVATPDFQFLVDLYGPQKTPLQERYISYTVDKLLPHIGIRRDVFVINNFFRDWGHKFIYDLQALSDVMSRAGLLNVARQEVGQSDDENLVGLESHGLHITEEFNRLETMVVEGTKPE